MKTLFDQTILRGLSLKNRVFRSATWMAMADNGFVTDDIVSLYQSYALGQVGGIITGFTSVSPYDGELPGAMQLTKDAHIAGHKRITKVVHAEGSKIFLQAALLDTFVESGRGYGIQKSVNDLTSADIASYISVYQEAACRAQEALYDGLQIHAAHFFGLSKWISPLCNQRTDSYGGNAQARAKLLLEIYNAIRQSVEPNFVILLKINCSDFTDGGLSDNDFLTTCQLLAQEGIDAIEVSGNGTSRPNIRAERNEAYFKDAALVLKAHLPNTPVILVGGIRSLTTINTLIDKDNIDYVSLSRPLLCEPDLVARWQSGDTRPARCISCNSCYCPVSFISGIIRYSDK